MSDIDSQVTIFKQQPTDELKKSILARLELGKADSEQLLQFVPEDQKAWLNTGLKDMAEIASVLDDYQLVWAAQSTLSSALTEKATTLTQTIQRMFVRQQQKVEDTVESAQLVMSIVAAIGIALAILLALSITRSITHPLNETLRVAEQIAKGDLTSTLSSTRSDEPGLLMQAVGWGKGRASTASDDQSYHLLGKY